MANPSDCSRLSHVLHANAWAARVDARHGHDWAHTSIGHAHQSRSKQKGAGP